MELTSNCYKNSSCPGPEGNDAEKFRLPISTDEYCSNIVSPTIKKSLAGMLNLTKFSLSPQEEETKKFLHSKKRTKFLSEKYAEKIFLYLMLFSLWSVGV